MLDMLSNFFYGPPKGSAPFSPLVDHEKNKVCSKVLKGIESLLKGIEAWNSKKIILTEFRHPPEGSVNFNAKWGTAKDTIEIDSICMCNTLFESS